jgi:tetratricopeptide (TPR) repeat protein
MLPEALQALEQWYGIPDNLKGRGFGMLASVYARAGRRQDALRLLDKALAAFQRTHVSPSSVALIYIGLGDFERAMNWLEEGFTARDHSLAALKVDPVYDPLRRNPRFLSLMRRMRLE